MQAVLETDIGIYFRILEKPNTTESENAYGGDIAFVINRLKKTNVLQIFDEQSILINVEENGYDLIIKYEYDNFHDLQEMQIKNMLPKLKIFRLKRNKDINQIMQCHNILF